MVARFQKKQVDTLKCRELLEMDQQTGLSALNLCKAKCVYVNLISILVTTSEGKHTHLEKHSFPSFAIYQ